MRSLTENKRAKSRKLAKLKLLVASGRWDPAVFTWENELFRKSYHKRKLDAHIHMCRECKGLNQKTITGSAPGWGNLNASIFFVGQSLCTKCMRTQIPFTEGSGYYIDAALRLSGLFRKDVFISNLVHCHPPKNRTSSQHEIANCAHFLRDEIDLVQPKLVVCLGKDAQLGIRTMVVKKDKFEVLNVRHPASYIYSGYRGIRDWIVNLSLELDKYV